MPKRLAVIGALFCIGGVYAIWDVIEALAHSTVNFNFAVFLLPVGIGLLRGKPSSRKWARVWIRFCYFVCALLTLFSVADPDCVSSRWFKCEVPLPYVVVSAVLFAALCYLIQRLLYSQKVTDYFERARPAVTGTDGSGVTDVGSPQE